MKIVKLLIVAFILVLPFQRSLAQADKKPATAQLNHIAILVADLKTATEFYHGLFNLEIAEEPFHDGKHTWLSLGNGAKLHIIQGGSKMTYQKNEHMCFSVPLVEAFVKTLNAKNIKFEDVSGKTGVITARVDGVKQIYFQDPDGHWLEVNDAKF